MSQITSFHNFQEPSGIWFDFSTLIWDLSQESSREEKMGRIWKECQRWIYLSLKKLSDVDISFFGSNLGGGYIFLWKESQRWICLFLKRVSQVGRYIFKASPKFWFFFLLHISYSSFASCQVFSTFHEDHQNHDNDNQSPIVQNQDNHYPITHHRNHRNHNNDELCIESWKW